MNWTQAFLVFTLAVPFGIAQQKQTLRPWPSASEIMASDARGVPLREANLSPTERDAVRNVTLDDIRDYCGADNKEESVFERLIVEKIHLADDGPITILLKGGGNGENGSRCLCGATGNCLTWVVRVAGGKGTVLYNYFGGGIVILKSQSHGYFNFVTAGHASARDSDLEIWRYNGEKYQEFRCASLRSDTGKISERDCRRRNRNSKLSRNR